MLAIGQPHVFGPLSRPPTPKAGENTSNQPDLDSDLERKPFYDEQNRFVPVLPDGFLGDLDKLRTQQGQHKHTPLREHALRRSLTGDDNKSPEAAGLGIDDASDPATLNLLRWDNWRDKLAAEMKQLELEEPSQSGST